MRRQHHCRAPDAPLRFFVVGTIAGRSTPHSAPPWTSRPSSPQSQLTATKHYCGIGSAADFDDCDTLQPCTFTAPRAALPHCIAPGAKTDTGWPTNAEYANYFICMSISNVQRRLRGRGPLTYFPLGEHRGTTKQSGSPPTSMTGIIVPCPFEVESAFPGNTCLNWGLVSSSWRIPIPTGAEAEAEVTTVTSA
jgi:hypothetical protein